ncbi:MAG TPA: hypothetical protein VJQ82_12260, partial [Terriglobales bacterium]|nr:hypothetical protein [Terriglobales bacterium]
MADNGVLGRLPKWPRNALNNSVIAAEQAYRKRSGLPLLSDADIEALKTGVPMSWESGNGGSSAPAPAATPAPAAPPPAAASTTPVAASGAISDEVKKQVEAGKKWSKSSIAAEQARRKRNNLAPLNDAEVAALLGEPVAAAAPEPAAPAAPTAPVAAAASAAISDEVKKMVAAGKKWSKSSIAAEQARRKRNNLPALNDAEVT